MNHPKYVRSLYVPTLPTGEYTNDYYQSPYGQGIFKVLADEGNYYRVESQDKKQKFWLLEKREVTTICPHNEYGCDCKPFRVPNCLIVLN